MNPSVLIVSVNVYQTDKYAHLVLVAQKKTRVADHEQRALEALLNLLDVLVVHVRRVVVGHLTRGWAARNVTARSVIWCLKRHNKSSPVQPHRRYKCDAQG